jgi:hypothetical protein
MVSADHLRWAFLSRIAGRIFGGPVTPPEFPGFDLQDELLVRELQEADTDEYNSDLEQ